MRRGGGARALCELVLVLAERLEELARKVGLERVALEEEAHEAVLDAAVVEDRRAARAVRGGRGGSASRLQRRAELLRILGPRLGERAEELVAGGVRLHRAVDRLLEAERVGEQVAAVGRAREARLSERGVRERGWLVWWRRRIFGRRFGRSGGLGGLLRRRVLGALLGAGAWHEKCESCAKSLEKSEGTR